MGRVGSLASEVERLGQPVGRSHVLLADLRTQLLLDDRTPLLGWRLSTKCTKGLLRRRRNILLRRRVDTTAITRVTPTSILRRSSSSRLFVGHVDSKI